MIIYGARTRKPEAMTETIALTASSIVFAFDTRRVEMPIQIPALDDERYLYRTTDVLHIDNREKTEHSYGLLRLRREHAESHKAHPFAIYAENDEILNRAISFRRTYLNDPLLPPLPILEGVFPYADPITRLYKKYTSVAYATNEDNPRVVTFGSNDAFMSALTFNKPTLQLIKHLKAVTLNVALTTFIREGTKIHFIMISPDKALLDIRAHLVGLDYIQLVKSGIVDAYALCCPLHTQHKEDY